MKILINPVFIFCFISFLLNQVLEKSGIFLPFIHSYADDFCCMPVILTVASAMLGILYFGKQAFKYKFRLSAFQVFCAVVYASVLFEYVLPLYSAKYVADFWDILAYTFGALLFWRFINPAAANFSEAK